MKNKKLFWLIFTPIILAVCVLTIDLVTKAVVFNSLPNEGQGKDFIKGFINFIHVENKGAAWGMMAGRPIFLIVISLIVMGLYLYFFVLRLKAKKSKSITLALSVGFISGGFFGNFVDRVVFGYVRDFINLQFIDFPVFNVADMSITVGVILMICYFLFVYSKEEKETKESVSEKVEVVENFEKDEKNSEKASKNEEKTAENENFGEVVISEDEFNDNGEEQ